MFVIVHLFLFSDKGFRLMGDAPRAGNPAGARQTEAMNFPRVPADSP